MLLYMISKAVKKLYRIIVDNNFQPLSPQELSQIAGYKTVNSIDQILSRNTEYFTVQGGSGNRRVGIPKEKKSLAIFVRDNFHCVYCNKQLTADNATIDHITPESKGKLSDPSNLATSCKSCNGLKKNMSVNRFIEDVLSKDRGMLARENVKRISGRIPKKKKRKTIHKTENNNSQSSIISDENNLKMIIRQIVQSEIHKKKKYVYKTVTIIERSGYWSWIEDDQEWVINDKEGQPKSTISDILNNLADDGWRCVQLIENKPFTVNYFQGGKQYTAILEKAR